MIDYPVTRHYQRYEYVQRSGIVDGRAVLDVGCGHGYGTNILAKSAYSVLGIDLRLPAPGIDFNTEVFAPRKATKIDFACQDFFTFEPECKFHVAVAIEVFEHVPDPTNFIDRLSEMAEEVFLTTPLANYTGKTRNKDHVNEYSLEDFIETISTRYIPQRILFQTADLNISTRCCYTGDSLEIGHTVQMCYATRRA